MKKWMGLALSLLLALALISILRFHLNSERSTLRLPSLSVEPPGPRGSGLTLTGAFLPRLKRLGLAPSNGSIEKKEEERMVLIQYREGVEKREEKDSHEVQLLKELRQTVDGWLKSINEEIDREDVTRFKVRFLEILRSILEWVREKLDSWLEPSDEDVPGKREKGGPFREIHKRQVTFSGIG
jgi:hypothetical protein